MGRAGAFEDLAELELLPKRVDRVERARRRCVAERLGDVAAEPVIEVVVDPTDQVGAQRRAIAARDLTERRSSLPARIGEALERFGRQLTDEARSELARVRHAEADRGGDRFADGDAVVRDVGRQVEQVARLEQPLRFGRIADAPASLAGELDQEDVVPVGMQPDAAAVAGPAEHDVVEPPVGDEAEHLGEGATGGEVAVAFLDEQRRTRFKN